jgi:hypothetical protein
MSCSTLRLVSQRGSPACRNNGRFLEMPRVCDPVCLGLVTLGMALIVLCLVLPGVCAFAVPFRVQSLRLFPIRFRPREELVGSLPEELQQVGHLQAMGGYAPGHVVVDLVASGLGPALGCDGYGIPIPAGPGRILLCITLGFVLCSLGGCQTVLQPACGLFLFVLFLRLKG